ncbi:hypothetical protein EJ05DRAFT_471916 [Pseudovirgaria hyperparasitica]|uniref:Uncharacterized protein n=1 Tax=Pseudovirgaria hyperparasitica TaxID=470096 RepID=A0A6A6WL61_9PEZI|nr:uncharacterized protein EJ05DRAFT_471916 [Pseudovirgaria hyperparasitica]KAF2762950.1 hypothetical protein EJ05DRAFT_471916 [Pseudovirgaria hyperparasitica]
MTDRHKKEVDDYDYKQGKIRDYWRLYAIIFPDMVESRTYIWDKYAMNPESEPFRWRLALARMPKSEFEYLYAQMHGCAYALQQEAMMADADYVSSRWSLLQSHRRNSIIKEIRSIRPQMGADTGQNGFTDVLKRRLVMTHRLLRRYRHEDKTSIIPVDDRIAGRQASFDNKFEYSGITYPSHSGHPLRGNVPSVKSISDISRVPSAILREMLLEISRPSPTLKRALATELDLAKPWNDGATSFSLVLNCKTGSQIRAAIRKLCALSPALRQAVINKLGS